MMMAEQPGDLEDDDEEGALGLEDLGEVEKRGIFARYHNSIVGAERTLKEQAIFGRSWLGWYATRRHSDDFLVFHISETEVPE